LKETTIPAKDELRAMMDRLPAYAEQAAKRYVPPEEAPMPDYRALVNKHNPRKKKKR